MWKTVEKKCILWQNRSKRLKLGGILCVFINKTKKQVKDFYDHYNYLIKESENIKGNTEVSKSYISNSLIEKICELKYKDYKKYKKMLKEDRVYDNLLTNTISRKIKKILLTFNFENNIPVHITAPIIQLRAPVRKIHIAHKQMTIIFILVFFKYAVL